MAVADITGHTVILKEVRSCGGNCGNFILIICQVGVFPHKCWPVVHDSEELKLLFIASTFGGKSSPMVVWCLECINTTSYQGMG